LEEQLKDENSRIKEAQQKIIEDDQKLKKQVKGLESISELDEIAKTEMALQQCLSELYTAQKKLISSRKANHLLVQKEVTFPDTYPINSIQGMVNGNGKN
jgi:hypothetical protein